MTEVSEISSADRIENRKRLRKQVQEHLPQARNVLDKSGMKPKDNEDSKKQYNRTAINVAGELVREKFKAETDGLTQIPNRDGFIRRGKEELERAKRVGYKVAVVVLDLNDLKETNDNQGHDAGDELLVNTAECLSQRTRTTDAISRWGGDEFGVVLSNTDYEGAQLWWQRLNELLNEKNIHIGAGVVVVSPDDLDEHGDWEQQFIKYRDLADKPLNTAKNQTKEEGENILLRYDKWFEAQSASQQQNI